MANKKSALVFIDTNILLDFYRVRGSDASLSLLNHVDNNHDKIITTYHVEMGYKKNRHSAIFESLDIFKVPNWSGLQVPAFLREAQPAKMIDKGKQQIAQQAKKIEKRIAKILTNPGQTDPVYKVLQRLFKAKGDIHLGRDKNLRHSIRRLALKRFLLGYPPRKPDDTSYGDAVNWEWIIHSANARGSDVVIVSRDSDYGTIYKSEGIINDWLGHEFRERVSQKKTVSLTNRLTEAFKLASIKVSKKEEQQERDLINKLPTYRTTSSIEEIQKIINGLGSQLPLDKFKLLQKQIETASTPIHEDFDSINKYLGILSKINKKGG